MRLLKVITNGCDRVADATYDFGTGDVPTDLVVITGGTASGKTSLLELIVAAKEDASPYGTTPFLEDWVRPGQAAAKIMASWWLDEHELSEVGGGAVRGHETIIDPAAPPDGPIEVDDGLRRVLGRLEDERPKLEHFHAGRSLPPPASFLGSGKLKDERHLRLLSADTKYASINAWLVELALGMHEPDGLPNAPGSKAIRFDDLLRLLSGTIAFGGLTPGASPEPLFARPDDTLRTLRELSHAERQAVIYAATCLRSNLDRSVALLDGPEHMTSTARAAEIVRILRQYNPTCQWIIATNPEVASKIGAARTIEMRA